MYGAVTTGPTQGPANPDGGGSGDGGKSIGVNNSGIRVAVTGRPNQKPG